MTQRSSEGTLVCVAKANISAIALFEGSETKVLHVVQTLSSKLHNHFQGR